MKVNTSRYCNRCRNMVAVKSLLWHTIKDYVTVRGDTIPGYVNMEDPTTRVDLHYCKVCWNTIVPNIEVDLP